ncbi:putative glycosyl transferase, family 2 [Aliivibrio wodanis]|uniref:Putative glycosyl transferase, family 2 n=1 Tax=Aliivibrio wodanis TaxID=80852 RepID=A0A090IPT8_9GAMM|nr:putative glycosyl transferase, family 2 [Aliivibrio wodanis]
MNQELKFYLDGIIHGSIQGWGNNIDVVEIYINNKLISQVPCDQYRRDLKGFLDSPNSSFTYTFVKDDIANVTTDVLNIDAIFIKNGESQGSNSLEYPTKELLTVMSDKKNQDVLNLDYYFDGIEHGAFFGWSSKADEVEIFIEGESIGTASLDLHREDLDNAYGFSKLLDGECYQLDWAFKSQLQISVNYLKLGTIIHKIDSMIDNESIVNMITLINGYNIKSYIDVFSSDILWSDNYYLSQRINLSRVYHKDNILDYVLIGSKMGLDPSEYFYSNYYFSTNFDVRSNNLNPLYHYLKYGEKEGRKPNVWFSSKYYAESNPDLERWNASLLSHFIMRGQHEGRRYSELNPIQNGDKNIVKPYEVWIKNHENETFSEIRRGLESFSELPRISIVVPVYNPEKELLIECIESVINQSYSNWELCLADDKSPKAHVREVLEEYAAKDKRIKPVFRKKNGHISAASNSALEVTTGEWIALLDHDDELHEHALYHVVKSLNDKPETELVYSDEDKIDQSGNRIDPHFKSDWNLDLLYSQNYVSHLGVYKAEIIKKIGGFRLGYEGSQDYDLLLRYSREIDHANIVHIPKVLYHWRMVEGSTALASGEKSYTTDAGIKALEDHFIALKKKVFVEEGAGPNMYKVNWNIINEPLVSLIIPTYNGYEITKQAIDSILDKSTYQNFEILLVDNNSNDETALEYFEEIDQHEKIRVLRYPYPFNYSAINNFAAKQAKGEIIGLVNNDVEVINPEWLTEMVSHAQRDDVGCVGAMLYFHNDTIQHAGVICGLGGVAGHSHKHFPKDHPGYFYRLKLIQNLSAVTAACLLVRKSVFDEVTGLNEKDLTVAFNDVDFCLKVQAAGYRNLWTPYAELYHYESISRGAEDNPEKVARFNKEADYMKDTWKTDKKADPCYSPNLSLDREDFSYNV